MAFTEVQDLDADTTTALGGRNKQTGKANPTNIEGYFIGSKSVQSKKSKTGEAKLHILKTSKGNVGVWGKTDLDRKMLGVTVGAMVRITQSGKVATPNGDMYKFKVEVDKENTIDVDLPKSLADGISEDGTEPSRPNSDYGADEEEYSEDEAVDSDEQAEDEVPPARAAAPKAPAKTPSAARQAEIKALLSKNRSKTV